MSFLGIEAIAMWWQIGCPVSRVNTCIRNYLLCDLVVMLIVSACIHNYLLCDIVIMLIEWRCYSLISSGFSVYLCIDGCIDLWCLFVIIVSRLIVYFVFVPYEAGVW